jgi:hypothetical protein
MREAGANRYAAEQLQGKLLDNSERTVPIYKDYEVTAEVLKAHDVIFVGRPEANLALAAWRGQLGLGYSGAAFKVNGKTYASEQVGLGGEESGGWVAHGAGGGGQRRAAHGEGAEDRAAGDAVSHCARDR